MIVANADHPATVQDMKPYPPTSDRFPRSDLKMLVIPGGEFLLGSHRDDEGPPVRVQIEPFWMSGLEVPADVFSGFSRRTPRDWSHRPNQDNASLIDIISGPSNVAGSGEFLHGPAINMTHHAASKFCQWLSAATAHFYRLPTEAEWEYACHGGTDSVYGFGDDPSRLAEFALFRDNPADESEPAANRAPNRWGLRDMHGSAAEWVLDGYDPDFRRTLADGVLNPWRLPDRRYPRVIKGGSWFDPADALRCAARQHSKQSFGSGGITPFGAFWWHKHADHVGFRIVRPLKTPSAAEMNRFWNSDWWNQDGFKEGIQ